MAAYVKAFPDELSSSSSLAESSVSSDDSPDFVHNPLPAAVMTGSLHRADLLMTSDDEEAQQQQQQQEGESPAVKIDLPIQDRRSKKEYVRVSKGRSLYWQTSFVNHWARA